MRGSTSKPSIARPASTIANTLAEDRRNASTPSRAKIQLPITAPGDTERSFRDWLSYRIVSGKSL